MARVRENQVETSGVGIKKTWGKKERWIKRRNRELDEIGFGQRGKESWRESKMDLEREDEQMKDERRHGGWMAEKEREG